MYSFMNQNDSYIMIRIISIEKGNTHDSENYGCKLIIQFTCKIIYKVT